MPIVLAIHSGDSGYHCYSTYCRDWLGAPDLFRGCAGEGLSINKIIGGLSIRRSTFSPTLFSEVVVVEFCPVQISQKTLIA